MCSAGLWTLFCLDRASPFAFICCTWPLRDAKHTVDSWWKHCWYVARDRCVMQTQYSHVMQTPNSYVMQTPCWHVMQTLFRYVVRGRCVMKTQWSRTRRWSTCRPPSPWLRPLTPLKMRFPSSSSSLRASLSRCVLHECVFSLYRMCSLWMCFLSI